MAPHNITYTAGVHSQQVNVQGQAASVWSISHTPSGTVSVNNPSTFHSDTTHMYYPTIPSYTISPSVPTQFSVLPRVHNIKREGECRTLDRPRTNTLRKVEPVNYRKSTYFVHTL